jgi:hypothetical protein
MGESRARDVSQFDRERLDATRNITQVVCARQADVDRVGRIARLASTSTTGAWQDFARRVTSDGHRVV